MPTIKPTGEPYPNNAIIDFGPLPPGDLGARATVQVMRAIIHSADRSGWSRRLAQKWSTWPHPDPSSGLPGSLFALWAHIKSSWTFHPDPTGTEWTAHPDHYIAELEAGRRCYGDCDDRAAFTAALIRGAGYPAALIIAGRHPRGRFEHVYPAVIVAGRAIAMDTQECAAPGEERPAARRRVYAV